MKFYQKHTFWKNCWIILGVYLSLITFIFLFFYFFNLIVPIQQQSAKFAYERPSAISFKIWEISTKNSFYKKYLKEEGIPESKIKFNNKNVYSSAREILTFAEENGIYIKLSLVNKFKEDYYIDLDYETQHLTEDNLIETISYILEGKNGKEYRQRENLFLENFNQINYKILQDNYIKTQESIPEKIYIGGESVEESNKSVSSKANSLVEYLKDKKIIELKKELLNPKELKLPNIETEYLENVSVKNISFVKDNNLVVKQNSYFKSGTITFFLGNCVKDVDIELYYNIKFKDYKFNKTSNLINSLCLKPVNVEETIEIAKCLDCKLYGVDKYHGLPSFYTPETRSLEVIGSNMSVSKEAYEDLIAMFNDAVTAGNNIQITSAYRSYSDQVATFEYWIQTEIAQGFDRESAEINANNYSAKPGFSEHQLGTTVDINSKDCDAFASYCPYNENLWLWLRNNAHLYGFVMSYPSGFESQTGYNYEPWHYRWIGKENALEYKKQEGVLTLNSWLRAKFNN